MFDKLCIIGPGLIGGSIAKAARQHGLCRLISGYGRQEDEKNLLIARELGAIDDYSINNDKKAIDGADCVIIATPVGAIEAVFNVLKPGWRSDVIYTDVGSTKTSVIHAARRVFGVVPENFIPAHPIAGAEQSGVSASVSDLFVNKRLIITPDKLTDPGLIRKMTEFWERLGAIVNTMTAEHHDAVFAATSHLPHILAFALVNLLGRRDEQSEIFRYASSGFRDFSRIASSDATMWLDICLANKDEIIPLIKAYSDQLDTIRNLLETDNKQQLFETFNYARESRQRFLDLSDN